ncbi:PA14 domain-containing protein [Desulfogranum marinum]|uniref:PA14 domain-containing protein n=1 Tax=Desulfogranum marinum TaxID=453220 RepID=UPI0029C69C95|nr:PA14 domain-containing protein [Desulfogranum marinum]
MMVDACKKKNMMSIWLIVWCLFFTQSSFAANAASAESLVKITGITPDQRVAEKIVPGLLPLYYLDFFQRDLKKLPQGSSAKYPSFRGEAILELNHTFGRGEVFASGAKQGVGMRLQGYLLFAEPGEYSLQAMSNDGIIMQLDGVQVLSDPKQHSDRLTEMAQVVINHPGWYPVVIEYFQRKGTATLQLLWKTPGSSDVEPIPASAYGHVSSPEKGM